MIDKIKENFYVPKCEYPRPLPKVYNCIKCNTNVDRTYKYCTQCGFYIENIIKEMHERHTRKRDIYREVEMKLYEEFKKDLLEEFGLTKHPKANEIFSYVWDKGHANGYMEVYAILENMHHLFVE